MTLGVKERFSRPQLGLHPLLERDDLADLLLAQRHRLDQELLGDLARLRFHHHDPVRGAGDHEVEVALRELLEGGLQHQFAIHVADPHGAHRSAEGDIGDGEGGASGDGPEGVRRVLHVDGEDGDHDLGIVPVAGGEEGAQRAVGEPRGEDRTGGRPPFPSEERAGDAAGGVEPLLKFDGEGEEIDAGARFAGGHRAEHHRVPVADCDRTTRLLRQGPCLDDQRAPAQFQFVAMTHELLFTLPCALRNRSSGVPPRRDASGLPLRPGGRGTFFPPPALPWSPWRSVLRALPATGQPRATCPRAAPSLLLVSFPSGRGGRRRRFLPAALAHPPLGLYRRRPSRVMRVR